MARKRYLTSKVSTNLRLQEVSALAALCHAWGVTQAEDSCRIPARTPLQFKLVCMPGRRESVEEIAAALDELLEPYEDIDEETGERYLTALLGRDVDGRYFFPARTFYKIQSYIKDAHRRPTPEIVKANGSAPDGGGVPAPAPETSGDQRRTPESTGTPLPVAENSGSPSPSPSHSLSLLKAGRDDAPAGLEKDQKAEGLLADEPTKPWHKPLATLYNADPRRFALLFGWCVAAEAKGYDGARVADALLEFQRYDAKAKIDSWARYLDTIIDRRTVRTNARDHEAAHEADKEQEGAWAKRIFATA